MATEGAEKNLEGQDEKVELTKEEYDAQIQKETDRRITQAQKKWEQEKREEMKRVREEAAKEAEEMAKLTAEEKLKVEKEKAALSLQKERNDLDTQRRAFEKERLMLETERNLTGLKIPSDFAQYLIGDDSDVTNQNIEVFKSKWQEAIEAELNDRLKGKSPKMTSTPQTRFTREQVAGMSKAEVRANLPAIEESMKTWK